MKLTTGPWSHHGPLGGPPIGEVSWTAGPSQILVDDHEMLKHGMVHVRRALRLVRIEFGVGDRHPATRKNSHMRTWCTRARRAG